LAVEPSVACGNEYLLYLFMWSHLSVGASLWNQTAGLWNVLHGRVHFRSRRKLFSKNDSFIQLDCEIQPANHLEAQPIRKSSASAVPAHGLKPLLTAQ